MAAVVAAASASARLRAVGALARVGACREQAGDDLEPSSALGRIFGKTLVLGRLEWSLRLPLARSFPLNRFALALSVFFLGLLVYSRIVRRSFLPLSALGGKSCVPKGKRVCSVLFEKRGARVAGGKKE